MSELYYVMVPGYVDPQLLEVDEVLRRIRTGELPTTAYGARPGEPTWRTLGDLPEVAGALEQARVWSESASGTPPPTPETPRIGETTGGETRTAALTRRAEAAPATTETAEAGVAPRSSMPKGILVGAGAAAVIMLVGTVSFVWYRGSYQRGLVFEHVPEACGELYYLDVAGLATSDPMRPHLDRLAKNARELSNDELTQQSRKIKERFDRALAALESNGVGPNSVREVVVCVPTADDDGRERASLTKVHDHGLLLVGGTFRRGDVLQGIKEAVEASTLSDEVCQLDDDGGLRILKCSPEIGGKKAPIYAGLVETRVLAISPDRKLLNSVRPAKDLARRYHAGRGEQLVQWHAREVERPDGSYGFATLKVGDNDTVIAIETHYDSEKGKKKLDELKVPDEFVKKKHKFLKDASGRCFEKSPVDMLADPLDATNVEAFDDGVRYEYKIANKDLGRAIRVLADADKDDLKKIAGIPSCITSAVDAVAPH